VHSGLEIFKKAANIKIKKIVKNSKMKRFQWKLIFTGSKTCCTISRPFVLAKNTPRYQFSLKSDL
jgi:hypothetical protein